MKLATLLLLAWLGLPVLAAGPLPAIGTVEVLFTPWDDAEGALLQAIQQARQTIHVQAFAFTSRNIAKALSQARSRGVSVRVLADREQTVRNERSPLHGLHSEGIPVWLEVRYASAHNKVILIDAEEKDSVVVTGSYNFTFSAQARNAENLLILRGNAPLARAYLENWRRHRTDAIAYAEAFPS